MKSRRAFYIPLAVLFIVAVVYQARTTERRIRYLMRTPDTVEWPIDTGLGSRVISYISMRAAAAGARTGDVLVSVNGRPYTGSGILADACAAARPGDSLSVVVSREGSAEELNLSIPVTGPSEDTASVTEWLLTGVLYVALPNFCLLLGFWVAVLRPRDHLAWILLGLMLSFGELGSGFDPVAWPGPMRYVAAAYYTFFESAWPIWMLLFGIYFPERLALDRKVPWFKWLLIVPLTFFAIAHVIVRVGSNEHLSAVESFNRFIQPNETPRTIIGMIAIGLFFMSLGLKIGSASSRDVRRRLKLMLIGTQVSLTPMFIVALVSLISGKGFFAGVPTWVAIPALLLLFLFPLTLAYVIVVQRAMDVSVVVRQGVRYAFAKGGVMTLSFLILNVIIFLMIWEIKKPSTDALEISVILLVGGTLIFSIGRLGGWLIKWTDRRFFREAVNAEQVLSDLSENVRTMVEMKPLIETVARTISESMHVPRVAFLLKEDGAYKPAYSLGYPDPPSASFPATAQTVERLRRRKQPVNVYLDDRDGWVERTAAGSERDLLESLDTELLLPLGVKDELSGFISLGPKQSEAPYSPTDLKLLQSVANQTGLALENSQLTAAIASEVAQRERLNREVEIAREVQQRLFPQKLPPISGLDYSGACRPALGVGGDYYDFLLLPNNLFGIAIGDVSGKGIAAALLMASLQASLRGQAIRATSDLADVIGNVNRLVYDASAENRYATFFYAQYEPQSRRLTYVNAGHNAPMILHKREGEWQIKRLEEGGAVVGLLPNFPYTQAAVELEPGDVLLAFTDGISEAMNTDDEEWGEEQLIDAAKACEGLSAADTISHIVDAADRFAAGADQHDDMTLLVVRVVG